MTSDDTASPAAGSGAVAEMAAFPLGTVLLPGQLLPLQVFENRYRVLLFDLREADPAEFVVVLIERGSEVGGGDVRAGVGCVAQVLQTRDVGEGRTLVAVAGTRRVRVVDWLDEDPYPRAMVEDLHERAWPDELPPTDADLVARVTASARSVGTLAGDLGASPWPADVPLDDDPIGRCWQLALLTPLATLDRQQLLAESDPLARWNTLEAMLQEQHELLRARVEWNDGGPGTGPPAVP